MAFAIIALVLLTAAILVTLLCAWCAISGWLLAAAGLTWVFVTAASGAVIGEGWAAAIAVGVPLVFMVVAANWDGPKED